MSFYTRILSIDPGAKRFGWAVIDFDVNEEMMYEPSYVSSGCIGLDRNIDETYTVFKNRIIAFFVPEFGALLEEYKPDLVVFEYLPITDRIGQLGQRVLAFAAATTAQVLCVQKKIEYKEIAATSIKKTLCGTMRATKTQIKKAVLEIFPQLEPKKKEISPDEADALAVGIAWMERGTVWTPKNIDT